MKTPNQVLADYFVGKYFNGREFTPHSERKEREQKMIGRKIDAVQITIGDEGGDVGMDLYVTDVEGQQHVLYICENETVYLQ